MSKTAFHSFVFLGQLLMLEKLPAQQPESAFSIQMQPIFLEKNIVLDEPLFDKNGDSLAIHELKFYLGNFEFLKNGQVVFQEKSHRLVDVENEKSLVLDFDMPENPDFDSLRFDLGVDSLTNVSGAMGGDLDPTRGMFWTWQSGYINFKLEGFFEKCPARNGEFQFHLGGYLQPFQTVQRLNINAMRASNPSGLQSRIQIDLDLSPFFEKTDWAKKPGVMSPGGEAVRLSEVLAKSFSIHAK